MEVARAVREIARSFSLLADDSRLLPLDSLTLIDVIVALEERLDIQIPPEIISVESFASVESLIALVERARASG